MRARDFTKENTDLPDMGKDTWVSDNWEQQIGVDGGAGYQRAQGNLPGGVNLSIAADSAGPVSQYMPQKTISVNKGPASLSLSDKGSISGSYNIPLDDKSSVSLNASGQKGYGVTGVGAQYQRGGFSAGVNQGNYPGAKPQFNVGYSAQFENDENLEEELRVDVPNEEWLQDKIDYAIKRGRNRNGVPYMGTATAYSRRVEVPVSILSKLPGMNREQENVRSDDLRKIMKIMRDTGKLPLTNSGKEYEPFINVAYNGEAWVNEGNHRIMAAAKLGWDSLPIEIRYFDGGERIEHGEMYPAKIGLA